jgi:hypothetical protein
LKEAQKRTDAQLNRTDEQLNKTIKKLEKYQKQLADQGLIPRGGAEELIS